MRWGSAFLRQASAIATLAFHRFKPAEPPPFTVAAPQKPKRQRSTQIAAADRLIADRSSTVRKMQRWLNNGSLSVAKPRNNKHLERHGWYRRQQRKGGGHA